MLTERLLNSILNRRKPSPRVIGAVHFGKKPIEQSRRELDAARPRLEQSRATTAPRRTGASAPTKSLPSLPPKPHNAGKKGPATAAKFRETPARRMSTCKERPENNVNKGGGSKPYIPWCKET